MLIFLIVIYLFVLSLLSFLFCHIIYENKMKNDLLFFVVTNFVLSFSFLVFLFYYKDYLLSLVNVFFLLLNTIFLSYELKFTYDSYRILSIPYLIYIVFLFYLIFDLYLMSL
jgi:hypothetical protein